MTTVIPLAGRRAAASTLPSTRIISATGGGDVSSVGGNVLFGMSSSPLPSTPELIGLHVQAENALATALHELRRLDATPATLRQATARATRAATLLKRASECVNGVEVCHG